jgi:hypothetical protein
MNESKYIFENLTVNIYTRFVPETAFCCMIILVYEVANDESLLHKS